MTYLLRQFRSRWRSIACKRGYPILGIAVNAFIVTVSSALPPIPDGRGGYVVEVAVDKGEIKDGKKVMAYVPKGTRLWMFEMRGSSWAMVKVPDSDERGWILQRQLMQREYFGTDAKMLEEVNRLAEVNNRLRSRQDWAAMVRLSRRRLRLAQQLFGEVEMVTADAHSALGEALRKSEDIRAARPHYEQALRTSRRLLGSHHDLTATYLNNLALLERDAGDYEKARLNLEEALKIGKRLDGSESVIYLYNLGAICESQQDFAAAANYWRRALAIRERQHDSGTPTADRIAERLANVIGKQEQTPAINTVELTPQRVYISAAELIRGAHQGPIDQIVRPNPQAFLQQLVEELPSRLRQLQGRVAFETAAREQSRSHTGDLAEDSRQLRRAIALYYLGREDRPRLGYVICGLADNYSSLGRFDEASEALLCAYDLVAKSLGERDAAMGAIVNAQAKLSNRLGAHSQSIDCLKKSIAINTAVAMEWDQILALPQAERRQRLRGAHQKSATTVVRTMAEFVNTGVAMPKNYYWPLVISAYAELAALQSLTGQTGDALDTVSDGQKILSKVFDADEPIAAKFYSSQAEVYRRVGELKHAKAIINKAIAIQERAYGEEAQIVPDSLTQLANICRALGEFDEAVEHQERAVRIARRLLGTGHGETLRYEASLPAIYVRAREFAKAEPMLRSLTQQFTSQLGDTHPNLIEFYSLHAEALSGLGRTSEALNKFRQAMQSLRRYVCVMLPKLSEREQLAFLAYNPQLYLNRAMQSLRPHLADAEVAGAMAEFLLNFRGLTLESLSQRRQLAELQQHPDVQQAAEHLVNVRDELSAATVAGELPTRITDLSRRAEELSKEIGRSISNYQIPSPWFTLEEWTENIPTNAALLLIHKAYGWAEAKNSTDTEEISPNRYLGLVIDPSREQLVRLVELGGHDETDDAVTRCRELLNGDHFDHLDLLQAEKEAKHALQILSDLVVRPLEDSLHEKQHWLIAADDALWSVPFACLLLSDGRYVVEDHQISYLTGSHEPPTDDDAAKLRTAGMPLIVANPDYDAGQQPDQDTSERPSTDATATTMTTAFLRGSVPRNWSPLPGTKQELDASLPHLVKFLNLAPDEIDAHIVTGEQASESRVKRAHNPSTVILSTHAFFTRSAGMAGLGVKVDTVDTGLEVQSVISGGAAEGNGELRAGDVIVAAAEEADSEYVNLAGKPLTEAIRYLIGAPETKVRIRIVKADTGMPIEVLLQRRSLGRENGKPSPANITAADNPLLRCGLVLAGANHESPFGADGDDGILTGVEVLGLNLVDTDLVVLSACETGVGDAFSMEGVVGLRHAFQLAGAANVVSTLWQIPDEQTAQLLAEFWKQLAEGRPKSASMQFAQKKLIQELRETNGLSAHPFFWAAFTLTGRLQVSKNELLLRTSPQQRGDMLTAIRPQRTVSDRFVPEQIARSDQPIASVSHIDSVDRSTISAGNELFDNSLGMRFQLIPAGTFLMGSTPKQIRAALRMDPKLKQTFIDRETPQHEVTISKDFYLGIYEVTRQEFRDFVDATGYVSDAERSDGGKGWNQSQSKFEGNSKRYSWRDCGFSAVDTHPVANVSWNDATAFCRWLSRKEKATYRLPTEAEWEYAARGGSKAIYSFGDDPRQLLKYANVGDESLVAVSGSSAFTNVTGNDGYAFTAPVGSFQPNAFGLFDMQGNVWEWCHDLCGEDYYARSPSTDPSGDTDGPGRIFRGGGFLESLRGCRLAIRARDLPTARTHSVGFRVALSP